MHTPPDTPDQTDTEQARIDRALSGTDGGSDTRAGSLRGGSASGSDIDPDSEIINADLVQKGWALSEVDPDTGAPATPSEPGEDEPGDDAEAATG